MLSRYFSQFRHSQPSIGKSICAEFATMVTNSGSIFLTCQVLYIHSATIHCIFETLYSIHTYLIKVTTAWMENFQILQHIACLVVNIKS